MKLKIDFSNPVIPQKEVLEIQPTDLDAFYCAASDFDKSNLYFMLEASSYYYEEQGKKVLAAHLCYLTAYYLFITLTPPGSCQLALHYINKSLELHPLPEYEEWLTLIKKGN